MGAIDNAKKHFKDQGRKEIVVPEWGDGKNPLTIYSYPITVRDRNWAAEFAENDPINMVVYTLIRMAQYEDGSKVFDLADKKALMDKVDSTVVVRVVKEMNDGKDIKDFKKK